MKKSLKNGTKSTAINNGSDPAKNQTKDKITYGSVDLTSEEDFDPKNVKERITIWLDEATVDEFRTRAKRQGSKYQTLINEALKEYLHKAQDHENRIARLEQVYYRFG